MPIVGIRTLLVMSAASSRGMPSSTNRERSRPLPPRVRRAATCSADSLGFPCTRYPPIAWTDCGVSPTWPITGISASVSRAITSRPPLAALHFHFTASAPASFTKRTAFFKASFTIALVCAKRHVRTQPTPAETPRRTPSCGARLTPSSAAACFHTPAPPLPPNRPPAPRPPRLRPSGEPSDSRMPSGR